MTQNQHWPRLTYTVKNKKYYFRDSKYQVVQSQKTTHVTWLQEARWYHFTILTSPRSLWVPQRRKDFFLHHQRSGIRLDNLCPWVVERLEGKQWWVREKSRSSIAFLCFTPNVYSISKKWWMDLPSLTWLRATKIKILSTLLHSKPMVNIPMFKCEHTFLSRWKRR